MRCVCPLPCFVVGPHLLCFKSLRTEKGEPYDEHLFTLLVIQLFQRFVICPVLRRDNR